MAREYARIKISIADDEDVEELSVDAQWLYFRVLIPDPTLSAVGIADWRPRRLLGKAADMTMERLLDAASVLEAHRFVLFDLDTEEVLVRSLIRNDRLLANPKSAVAVVKGYRAAASKVLRAAVVSEIKRDHEEHPEYSCWTKTYSAEPLEELLAKPDLTTLKYQPQIALPHPVITDPITNRNGDHIGNRIGNRNTNRITNQNSDAVTNRNTDHITNRNTNGIPYSPYLQPSTSSLEGLRKPGTSPEPAADSGDAPPPRCPDHLTNPATGPCGPCGDARRANDAWHTTNADQLRQQATETRRADREHEAAARRTAIDTCTLCNDDGYRGNRVCDHIDRTDVAARGSAAVRAAMRKRTPAEPEGDPAGAGDGDSTSAEEFTPGPENG